MFVMVAPTLKKRFQVFKLDSYDFDPLKVNLEF